MKTRETIFGVQGRLMNSHKGYYYSLQGRSNRYWFKALEISNVKEFCAFIVGYTPGKGDFPYFRTPRDAYLIVKSLLQLEKNSKK